MVSGSGFGLGSGPAPTSSVSRGLTIAKVWWEKVPVPKRKKKTSSKRPMKKVIAKKPRQMVVGTLAVTVEEDGKLVASMQSIQVMAGTTRLPNKKQLETGDGACGCAGPTDLWRYAGTLRFTGLKVPDYAIKLLPKLEGLDLPGRLDDFARGLLNRKEYADLPKSHRETIVLLDPSGGKVQRLKKQAEHTARVAESLKREKALKRPKRGRALKTPTSGSVADKTVLPPTGPPDIDIGDTPSHREW
jgi:hypothetical protein